MTFSSGSTGSRLAAVGLAVLIAGGCGLKGSSPGHVATVRGYADLDALVRHHPGWMGVAQYDLALLRLQKASVRLNVPAGDTSLASLPANTLPLPPLPAEDRQAQQRRLETVKQTQIARLRAQRAQSRAAVVFPLQEAWQREADTNYVQAVQTVQASYLRRLRREAAGQNTGRLNLTLQIRALQNTIEGWKVSPPPTPILNEARASLAAKLAQLTVLDRAQAQARQVAAQERDTALAEAQATRAAYVQTRTNEKLVALHAEDDAQIAAFGARLAQQEQALLTGPSLSVSDLPGTGALGAEALPAPPPGATPQPGSIVRSQAQLVAAEGRLRRQRARWLAFLYDDTRAAALDAAQQQHWQVTFGRTGAGAALTEPLARILTTQVWKT